MQSNTVGGNGGNKFKWTPNSNLSTPALANTLANPIANGYYKITVTDQSGCKSSDSTKVSLFPYPIAKFGWPTTCQGNQPLVTDSSTISAGKIKLLEWKYNGIDTFNAKTISLPIGNASKITTTLIAISDIGCSDTFTRFVDVKANPKASFNVLYVCIGDSSKFNNTSILDSGTITQVLWNFDDASISNKFSVNHQYNNPKDFAVQLKVQNNWGCTDSIVKTARVFPKPQAA